MKLKTLFNKMAFLSFVILSGCLTSESDFEKGKKILEQQGFVDIKNVGYVPFCCDVEKDVYSTGFECKDLKNNVVKGCFCSSGFKGLTIRFQ